MKKEAQKICFYVFDIPFLIFTTFIIFKNVIMYCIKGNVSLFSPILINEVILPTFKSKLHLQRLIRWGFWILAIILITLYKI